MPKRAKSTSNFELERKETQNVSSTSESRGLAKDKVTLSRFDRLRKKKERVELCQKSSRVRTRDSSTTHTVLVMCQHTGGLRDDTLLT